MSEERERWTGRKRRDGLAIVEGLDGLVIMPTEAGLPIDRCPCCAREFASNDAGFRSARLVADMLYPLKWEATSDAD